MTDTVEVPREATEERWAGEEAERLTRLAHETVKALREAGSDNWSANIGLMHFIRRALLEAAERKAAAPAPDQKDAGPRIIESLKQAVAGDFARVTIDGQVWVRQESSALKPSGE